MGIALFLGYLLGSLPFGVWISKLHGVCIFEVGSGSPGATNVLRTLGKKAGYTVFALDALKGCLAVILGTLYWQSPYGALLGALLGHCYPLFAHFKGGKGVATLIGGLIYIIPVPLILALVVWGIVFKWLRYVSCASLCCVLSLLPFCCLCYGFEASRVHAIPLLILNIGVFWRHRANLKRLWNATEHRF
jgi:glycerol-3-phosphate acyltransferase PlsY